MSGSEGPKLLCETLALRPAEAGHVIIQTLTREEADIHGSKHTEMLLTDFALVSFIA